MKLKEIFIDGFLPFISDYLTHCMETFLYFTIPEEDFACIPLRMFLSTLLANVVCKPVIDMLSEPDFINQQVAKSVWNTTFSLVKVQNAQIFIECLEFPLQLTKEPPTSEIFLRLLRQCDEADELRAVRQLITKEMDAVSMAIILNWSKQSNLTIFFLSF